jgi:hypothetical protein
MATQDEIREGKKQVLLSKLRLYADENGKIDKEIVLECIIEVCGVSKDTKKAWWAALHAWGFLTTTIKGKNSHEIAGFMAERGLFVWDGDFYAIEITNHVLKLAEQGGLLRIGLAPYNTMEDIDRTIQAVKDYVKK